MPQTSPVVVARPTAAPVPAPIGTIPFAGSDVPERELLGIPFATLDLPAVAALLAARPASDRFVYLATPNVQHLVLLRRGAEGFAYGLSRAWFLTCDSQVLRRLARRLFGLDLPLVTGSDLTVRLLRDVIGADDPITVIGGSDRLRADLAAQFGLRRIALHSPPFGFSRNEAEMQRCVDFVRANPARFVFLACGAPQSEMLAARLVDAGGASGIGLCIGAALLFATGQLRRAPLLWQRLGMEWFHRLLQDRRRMTARLWKAQLPVFAMAARAWLSPRGGRAHASRLERPASRLPAHGRAHD
jgi:exopolysaccharide biosynthesis WecB/TagA/CpsF family protein